MEGQAAAADPPATQPAGGTTEHRHSKRKRKKLEKYAKGPFIGQGTYGVVYQATEKSSNRKVALKKIRMGNVTEDGVSFVGLREIKLLKELRHPNIIEVCDKEFCDNLIHISFCCS